MYNCYYTGYLNVTGVRTIKGISVALDVLAYFLDLPEEAFEKIKIDNITAKCKILSVKCVSLRDKKMNLQNHKKVISLQYRREIFPNMFIKTKYCTIIWSTRNQVSCVGIKNEHHLSKILNLIKEIDLV